jgi:hypothetical protein
MFAGGMSVRCGREVVRAVMVLCTCVRCSVLCGVLVMLMALCGVVLWSDGQVFYCDGQVLHVIVCLVLYV